MAYPAPAVLTTGNIPLFTLLPVSQALRVECTVAVQSVLGSKTYIDSISLHPSASAAAVGRTLQATIDQHISKFALFAEKYLLLRRRVVFLAPKAEIAYALDDIDLENGQQTLFYPITTSDKKPNLPLTQALHGEGRGQTRRDLIFSLPKLASNTNDAELVVIGTELDTKAANIAICIEICLGIVSGAGVGFFQKNLGIAFAIVVPCAVLAMVLKVALQRKKT